MRPLKTVLAAYTVPPPDAQAVQITTACLRRAAAAHRPRLSDAEFLRRQLGFISPRMWALQALFAAALCGCVLDLAGRGGAHQSLYPVLGAAAPLLVLINISDWVRVYNGGMLELELATRCSLPRVAAARMLIFGVSDTALLLALCAVGAAAARAGLLLLLAWMLAPFNAMCAVCLWLLRRVRPQQLTPGAVLAAAVLAGATAAADHLARLQPGGAWPSILLPALAVSALALVWQGRAFLRQERGALLADTVL